MAILFHIHPPSGIIVDIYRSLSGVYGGYDCPCSPLLTPISRNKPKLPNYLNCCGERPIIIDTNFPGTWKRIGNWISIWPNSELDKDKCTRQNVHQSTDGGLYIRSFLQSFLWASLALTLPLSNSQFNSSVDKYKSLPRVTTSIIYYCRRRP